MYWTIRDQTKQVLQGFYPEVKIEVEVSDGEAVVAVALTGEDSDGFTNFQLGFLSSMGGKYQQVVRCAGLEQALQIGTCSVGMEIYALEYVIMVTASPVG